MNAMTCAEVQEQLDLLAAGACDVPLRDALEHHLQQCPVCATSYAESRRVVGLLDLRLRQDGLERLYQRIEEEASRRRKLRLFTPFMHRAALAAALVLIAVGLMWWLPGEYAGRKGPTPEFALLVRSEKPGLRNDSRTPATVKDKGVDVMVVPVAVRDRDAFRRALIQAQRDGKLPLPPTVSLKLVLVNIGKRPVTVHLGDAAAKLWLDVLDAGVVRIEAPQAETPECLRSRILHLDPGQEHVLHIDRIVAGSPGKLEYIYVSEPGEVTLTPRLRLTANGMPIMVTGATVRIPVTR